MARKIVYSFIIAFLAVSPVMGQDWATKMFKTTEHDFGTVARGAKAEFDFQLSNLYLDEVHILSVQSSCGCTTPVIVRSNLKTYEDGAIHATFNTPTFTGSRAATLTVTFDKPYYAEVQLHVRGYIRSDMVFNPGSVKMTDVDQGTAAERRVTVSYSGGSNWQLLGVKSSNPSLSAAIVKSAHNGGWASYDLAVRLAPNAPVGYFQDHLMLVSNESNGAEMPLAVEGRVLPAITVSPASLYMGVVKPGQEVTKSLVVKAKQPFRILAISCGDKSFTFGSESDTSAKPVHLIPVKFLAGNNSGKIAQTIRIKTDLGQNAPELSVVADVSATADEQDK